MPGKPRKQEIGRQRVDTVKTVPTSTEQLRRRGSWRAKGRQETPKSVPDPEGIQWEGTYPAMLPADYRPLWDDLKENLNLLGVYSRTDKESMVRRCGLQAQWNDLSKQMGSYDRSLDWSKAPIFVAEYYKVNDALLRLDVQFALTPASRAGAQIVQKTEKPPHGNSTEGKKLKERFRREAG